MLILLRVQYSLVVQRYESENMRIKVPITGTVRLITPTRVSGEDSDPIRMININLGNVRTSFVSLDLENEEMELEVTPVEKVVYDTGEIDGEGKSIRDFRSTTPEEKEAFIEHARNYSLERMSKEALYALSGSSRLKNLFKERASA